MSRDIFEEILVPAHKADDSYESVLVAILEHIRENRKIITGLLTCDGMDIFIVHSREYLLSAFTAPLLAVCGENPRDIPKDFLLNHLTGSFIEAVKWWAATRMEAPPEDIARYYMRVIRPVIDSLKNI